MTAEILHGKPIAQRILNSVADEVEELKKQEINPLLMTIEVGDNPASKVYLNAQQKVADQVGISCEFIQLSPSISQTRLLKVVNNINRDISINGVIMHVPLPEHLNTQAAQWHISSSKDIEGVTPANLGVMFLGGKSLVPCTAKAMVEMIKSTGTELRGKEVVVVGSSNIVGKPLSILLLGEMCTVTICHIATSERGLLEEHVRNADIVAVAVGVPHLIKGEWIKDDAIVIDAGINTVDGKLVGDVDFEAAKEHAAWITPVPGGVGTVTTALLMKNTIEAVRDQYNTEN
ncbi:MAG: bifunctional 5,10-methylenetetrahydrofolate dehydrogenase/5,10-methenyltetrahydrofolate cyclohydrolase [Methylocystaceae bacterium]